MKNKVFLGGTCNESTWRNELIPLLKIDYFNPVVEDWTPECQAEEERQKNEECNYQLYVITPKMTGVFSIAEVIESAITRNDKTLFCIIPKDGNLEFDKGQLKSLNAVGNMVKKYNGIWCKSLDEIANYLNNESKDEKIRQYLIKCFTGTEDCAPNIKGKDVLAWLEKQGKKTEPIEDFDTEFERQISHLIASAINREHEYNKGYVKWATQSLIEYAKREIEKQGEQKPAEWHREDEQNLNSCLGYIPDEFLRRWLMDVIHEKYDKPADKVEPKFKVGDWVVYDHRVYQVVELPKEGYINLGLRRNGKIEFAPSTYCRPWTIGDAKDGDVLACPNDAGDRDVVFIFKNINSDEGWIFCFCASDANGCFCTNNDYVGNYNSTNIYPATKEQRDTLERAITNAGYRWDKEKLKLEKI